MVPLPNIAPQHDLVLRTNVAPAGRESNINPRHVEFLSVHFSRLFPDRPIDYGSVSKIRSVTLRPVPFLTQQTRHPTHAYIHRLSSVGGGGAERGSEVVGIVRGGETSDGGYSGAEWGRVG